MSSLPDLQIAALLLCPHACRERECGREGGREKKREGNGGRKRDSDRGKEEKRVRERVRELSGVSSYKETNLLVSRPHPTTSFTLTISLEIPLLNMATVSIRALIHAFGGRGHKHSVLNSHLSTAVWNRGSLRIWSQALGTASLITEI